MEYKITFSARFHYRKGCGVSLHYHPDYQIQLVYSGRGEMHLNGEYMRIAPNDIVFIKQGSSHDFTVISSEGMRTLEIKFTTKESSVPSLLSQIKPLFQDVDRQVMSIFSRIVLEGQRKILFYRDMSEALLLESLIAMSRICGFVDNSVFETAAEKAFFPTGTSSHIIELVDNYIARNGNTRFLLSEMADALGYNRDYLYRMIKKATGVSAVQYVNRIKFEKAKQMIQHTELNMTEIAWNLGFDDLPYFSRFFKKYSGISPSEYSEKVRETIRTDY